MLTIAPLMIGGFLSLSFQSNPDYYSLLVLSIFIDNFGAVKAFFMPLCLSMEYVGASVRILLGIPIQVTYLKYRLQYACSGT